MRILLILLMVLVSLGLASCSMPASAVQKSLYSFTKEEKTTKGGFMSKKRTITIQDFRRNEVYDEDIENLKAEVETYISQHPDLSESVKDNLRGLKVTQGSSVDEVALLLGKPDKVMKESGRGRYGATKIWIYKLNKMRAFTIFIFPVFVVHEGYYLYFKDGALVEIERHYLKQAIQQGSGRGGNRIQI